MVNPAVYEKLLETARAQTLITYSDLCFACGLDLNLGKDSDLRLLMEIMGEINDLERESGRPILTAVAVHKHDHRPGNGFYQYADGIGARRTGEGKDAFHNRMVKEVHLYWKSHPA